MKEKGEEEEEDCVTKVTGLVEAPAAKPDVFKFSPQTHVVEGENRLLQVAVL